MARDVILRFASDTRGLEKGFAEAGKSAQQTETLFAKVSGGLGGISTQAVAAAAGFAGVATSVVGFVSMAISELGEQQKAMAQTEAVIRSTGGAANVTAKQVADLAEQLSKMSGVDDEVIQGGENLLATFTGIQNRVGAGNNIFDQATKAALDMSVALGEDMSGAAIRVGKALNDPIAGVTALRRVGVQLTDQQEATVKGFVATGDVMSAQKVILAELNREFGGSAEAYGKTLPGSIGKARTAIGNWSASIAEEALPVVQSFARGAGDLARAVGPPLLSAFEKAGDVVLSVGRFLNEHRGYVVALAGVYMTTLIPAVISAMRAFAVATWTRLASAINLAVTSVRVLALEMGTLRLAIGSLGLAALTVGLGYVVNRFISAESKAKSFAATLAAGFDTSSLQGMRQALVTTLGELSAAYDATRRKGNAIIDILTFKGLDRKDAEEKAKALQAQADALEAQIDMVTTVGAEYGVSADEVIRFANAEGINLAGPVEQTTQLLRDQFGAAAEATKGWTGYGLSVADAAEIQSDLKKAFEDAADPVAVYTAGIKAATEAAKADRDAMDDRHRAERQALEDEKITGSASQAAHDRKMKELEVRQAAEKKTAEVTAEANKKVTLSMEDYRKLVEANTKKVRAWMQNLAIITARGGADIVDELAALGPEYAGLVEEIAKSPEGEFGQLVGTMRDASKTATDAAADELNKLPSQVQTIAQTSGQQFASNLLEQVAQGIVPLSDLVAKAAVDAVAAAYAAAAAAVPPSPSPPPPPTNSEGALPSSYFTWADPFARHAEGHVAQIAPAGSWRLWAEPETGGEAYIPLAYSKRARSTALLADVASRFGMGLVPMADGGMWAVPASSRVGGQVDPALVRTLNRIEQRLARGGGRIDSVVFQEKIDPLHAAQKISWALSS